jgi:hypothetical protein
MVHGGISMNAIVYCQLMHIYQSDGKGGYSDSGFAWRYYIPPGLRFQAINNLLEYLAAIIMPWINIIAHRLYDDNQCSLLL